MAEQMEPMMQTSNMTFMEESQVIEKEEEPILENIENLRRRILQADKQAESVLNKMHGNSSKCSIITIERFLYPVM